MTIIRWGIIGCGDVTEVMSGPGFQKAKNSALVAVMRRTGSLAADYAQRHNVQKWYDDADLLIHDPDVDVVYVATQPDTHCHYVEKVAAAGKPVYVEKPMARSFAECQHMIDVCTAASVPLWVGYYRRMLPKFCTIIDLINEGAIGEVHTVSLKFSRPAPKLDDPNNLPWRLVPEIGGSGLFRDIAAHRLDLLDLFLGPIKEAEGFAQNLDGHYSAEDTVAGSFMFETGVLGVGRWHFNSFESVDITTLEGTKGSITYACFDQSPIVLNTVSGCREVACPQPPHVHQPLIQTIVDELNGDGRCPSTGESGARTSWVMDQMLAEYRQRHNIKFAI